MPIVILGELGSHPVQPEWPVLPFRGRPGSGPSRLSSVLVLLARDEFTGETVHVVEVR